MRAILVVREFDDFSRILSESNFETINCPTIKTEPLEDLSEFEAKLDAIENYDGIFLTSRRAAEILRAKVSEKKINYRGKVFVLGKRSFELLKVENLDVVFDETANTASEMLERIRPDDLKNKRFLFVRGEKSLRVVPEFLGKIAAVDETIVYQTDELMIDANRIKEIRLKSANGEICAACFFSPSGAESFLRQFGAGVLHQMKTTVIGNTTRDFFERHDLPIGFVTKKATAEDYAAELIEYLRV